MNNFCTLRIKKHLGQKANYHTHTTRCKHAWGTEREYIENAIKAGYEVLGFSDHAPYLFDDKTYVSRVKMDMEQLEDYVMTIDKLKEEYKTAIYLIDYERFSYKEAGIIMGKNSAQMKILIFRARKKLKLFIV